MGQTHTTCELARRRSGGVEVQLVWDRASDQVAIVYSDLQAEQSFVTVIPNDRALDAFRHPNAYRSGAASAQARNSFLVAL